MRKWFLLAGLCVIATSCSSAPKPLAVIASHPATIGTGDQRILIALIDPATNEFMAAEDIGASATLRDEDGTPLETIDLDFVWTLPDVRGLYVAEFEIPEAGVYQLSVAADGMAETGPTGFQAVADPVGIGVGDKAPASETRTASEFPDLSVISSDPDPDPDLYRLSVAGAVSDGEPSVIIFATPAFCESQACGPMLNQVKELRGSYPGIDFVHVEVYEDLQVQSREDLTVVDSVTEWGLPSEPWVFVVDSDGVVTAAFEGAVNNQELLDAFDAVGS